MSGYVVHFNFGNINGMTSHLPIRVTCHGYEIIRLAMDPHDGHGILEACIHIPRASNKTRWKNNTPSDVSGLLIFLRNPLQKLIVLLHPKLPLMRVDVPRKQCSVSVTIVCI